MSRCFPFPPPGYEKKTRGDHADLLPKEKHKEKKHKKEKDKEKREGKERKDKERSKDKDKEKDRKEKHKDKKRDKDKDRDKKRSSDGRAIEERNEGRIEEKLGESSRKAEDVKNFKFTEELGRRIRDEEKGAANRLVENTSAPLQRRPDNMGSETAIHNSIHKRLESSELATEMEKDGIGSKMVPSHVSTEQRRGFGNEMAANNFSTEQKRGFGNEMFANNFSTEQRRGYGNEMSAKNFSAEQRRGFGNEMSANNFSTEQRRAIENEVAANLIRTEQRKTVGHEVAPMAEQRKTVGHEVAPMAAKVGHEVAPMAANLIRTEQRKTVGHEVAPNIINGEQRRDVGMARPIENMEKKIEEKEKSKYSEPADGKRKKHKDRDREEKRNKGKEKDKHKEKEKEKEKTGESKQKEHDKGKDSGRKDQLNSLNCKALAPARDNGKDTGTDESMKKRKHSEMNGFVQENEVRPDKLLKPTSSSRLPLENGRTLESCHFVASPHSIMKNGSMNNIKADKIQDNKDHRINGILEPLPSSVDLRPSAAVEKRANSEASCKPPHPDTKYLSCIYTVPKMDEWPEIDNQEWLFGNNNIQRKPKVELATEGAHQVWAEACQIDSADVLALPYVVPY